MAGQTSGYAIERAEIDVAGRIFDRIRNVSHNQPVEIDFVFGSTNQPLLMTRGQLQGGEGSLEIEFEQGEELLEHLGDGFLEKQFTLSLTYRNRSSGKTIVYVFEGCRLTDSESDHASGSEALMMTLPFAYLSHTRNGLRPMLD